MEHVVSWTWFVTMLLLRTACRNKSDRCWDRLNMLVSIRWRMHLQLWCYYIRPIYIITSVLCSDELWLVGRRGVTFVGEVLCGSTVRVRTMVGVSSPGIGRLLLLIFARKHSNNLPILVLFSSHFVTSGFQKKKPKTNNNNIVVYYFRFVDITYPKRQPQTSEMDNMA